MIPIGIPDLSSFSTQSRAVADSGRRLDRLSAELATGVIDDPVRATNGDPLRLYQIEAELSEVEANRVALDQGRGRASAAQLALERLEAAVEPLGAPLLAAAEIGDAVGALSHAEAARGAFEDMIAALNTRFSDRSLFAGAAVDRAALASGATILAEIEARIPANASAPDIVAAVDDYFFTDPGGFAASGFTGSTLDAPALRVGDEPELDYAARADDEALVAMLAAVAIAVFGAEGDAGANRARTLSLLQTAGDRIIGAAAAVTGVRARLGGAEARMEELAIREAARGDLLEQARLAIVKADPFEAATELKQVETSLQTVFSVTARLSELSLVNFLR